MAVLDSNVAPHLSGPRGRLLLTLALSVGLHLSVIYGLAIGPSQFAPTQTIVARLVSPPAWKSPSTPEVSPVVVKPPVPNIVRSVERTHSSEPTPATIDAPRSLPLSPEPASETLREPMAEQQPAQPADERLPRADVPSIVDSAWYAARDLDVYPRALSPIEPLHPLSAAEISGIVSIELSIDQFGAVQEATIVSAEPEGFFEEAALQAVRTARFSPAQREGHDVRSRIVIKLRFAAALVGATR